MNRRGRSKVAYIKLNVPDSGKLLWFSGHRGLPVAGAYLGESASSIPAM
jgi:hypothetical protein